MLATLSTPTQDITVLRAELSLPYVGLWHATLLLDNDTEISGQATLKLEAEGISRSLQGTLLLANAFAGKTTVKLLSGLGGYFNILPSKAFQNTDLRTIILATLTDAGEQLDPASDLTEFINHYLREEGTCSKTLWELARFHSKNWFVQDNGKFFFGEREQEEFEGEVQILSSNRTAQKKELALLTPDLNPGNLIEGEIVDSVYYQIHSEATRCFVRVRT